MSEVPDTTRRMLNRIEELDTDQGGRKADRRAELRETYKALAPMTKWTRTDWDLLPGHDAALLMEVLASLQVSASEINRVRWQQSGSRKKRGKV